MITAIIDHIRMCENNTIWATLYPSDGYVHCGRLSTALGIVKEKGYVVTNAQDVLMQLHEIGIV